RRWFAHTRKTWLYSRRIWRRSRSPSRLWSVGTTRTASPVTRRFCANDCLMHALMFSRPVTASGRSERPSSSRSSRNGCVAAFEDSCSWRRHVIDRDRQQHDRSHADPPGEWAFLRLPSLRQRPWVAVALPAALHRNARQLGSRRQRSARVRTRGHPFRQRRSRALERRGARDGGRNGGARHGLSRWPPSRKVRRSWF